MDLDFKEEQSIPSASVSSHVVKKRDTLYAIAKKYYTSIDKIVAANKGKYPKITATHIVVGGQLYA